MEFVLIAQFAARRAARALPFSSSCAVRKAIALGVRKAGAPVKTGELKGMKESNSERIANCTGPEPCVVVRKDEGEASVGVHAGWPLSREIRTPRRKLRTLRGADTLDFSARQYRACRHREARTDPARSETPRTHGINSHGNREVLASSVVEGTADRIVKPKGKRR